MEEQPGLVWTDYVEIVTRWMAKICERLHSSAVALLYVYALLPEKHNQQSII